MKKSDAIGYLAVAILLLIGAAISLALWVLFIKWAVAL